MAKLSSLPISLKIVAILFILGGIRSAIETGSGAAHGHFNANISILGLFIGPGLLYLKRGWRTCALVVLLLQIFLTPVAILYIIFVSDPLYLTFFDEKTYVSKTVFEAILAIGFILACWEFWALKQPKIMILFESNDS